MKKLLVALALALLLFSCNTGNMENDKNPFIGTWEDESRVLWFERFIFTNNEVTRKTNNETNTETYEYNNEIIFFDYTSPNVISIRADYTIENNNLTMTFLNTHKTFSYKKVN